MNEKDKFEYEKTIDLGKFMYDTFFKLAAMTFTINGLLLAALSFFFSTQSANLESLRWLGVNWVVVALCSIALIYNMGAAGSFMTLSQLAGGLWKRFEQLDGELKLNVRNAKNGAAESWAVTTSCLTIVFFCFWMLLWVVALIGLSTADLTKKSASAVNEPNAIAWSMNSLQKADPKQT